MQPEYAITQTNQPFFTRLDFEFILCFPTFSEDL